MYIFPTNLKAKPKMWLWELRSLAVIGVGLILSVLALANGLSSLPLIVTAIYDLGIAEETDDRFQAAPDAFSSVGAPRPLPRSPEEFLSYICDEVCKERIPGRTQEELDAICAKCAVERLAAESDAQELASREAAHWELNGIIDELRETRLCTAAERLEHEARA